MNHFSAPAITVTPDDDLPKGFILKRVMGMILDGAKGTILDSTKGNILDPRRGMVNTRRDTL